MEQVEDESGGGVAIHYSAEMTNLEDL